jgi:hypothetical protein
MVSAIKKWLGIEDLERESLTLARALVTQGDRIHKLEEEVKQNALESQKSLTPEPAKPKIVAKSKAVNWRGFAAAAEKASEPEREEV